MAMSLSQLVFRSMLKNMKQYFLYFFALSFSVTLYFSFVTLQYNETVLDQTAISGTATAGFEAATYLLYFIVLFFVLYANHLFMKRRSKEIGMYQLIGMTKGLIIRLIALENILLFIGAVIMGMIFGMLSSRIFAMVLFVILEKDIVVAFSFSSEAIVSSLVVFGILLILVCVQMAWIIHRVSLLSLFTASKQADERVRRFNWWKMAIGAFGIVLIIYGYYKSTTLFESGSAMFMNMVIILATTIGGTFLVFRFSVAFIMNSIRLRKKGHLSTVDVLAFTPVLHRMKGNAKSLTLITVLTAVSLAITTLSYIAYYSAEETAFQQVPADYVFVDDEMPGFLPALNEVGIGYTTKTFHPHFVDVPMNQLVEMAMAEDVQASMAVLPVSEYRQIDGEATLSGHEAILESHFGYLNVMFQFDLPFEIDVKLGELDEGSSKVVIKEVRETPILSLNALGGGGPILIVSDEMYAHFKQFTSTFKTERQMSVFIGDGGDLEHAEVLFEKSRVGEGDTYYGAAMSKESERRNVIDNLGIIIFVTAFLGLAFLLATCSILYFKQTAEADEQKDSFTIMRKIGFSEQELMRGIYAKQLFNFGVPLLIGLLHSYFAVKSGWFLFGSEMLAPMLITMALYIAMYIVFALLSISYYRKVIRDTL